MLFGSLQNRPLLGWRMEEPERDRMIIVQAAEAVVEAVVEAVEAVEAVALVLTKEWELEDNCLKRPVWPHFGYSEK